MSFLCGGAKRRRDAIEPAIVEALKALGATVIQLSGRAPVPDLLVGFRGQWFPMEVKSGASAKLTTAQLAAAGNGQQQPIIVRSVEDAIAAVRFPEHA